MKYSYYITKDRGYVYRLDEPVTYDVYGKMVIAPKGTLSDGASIPKWLHWLVSPRFFKVTLYSSICHDHLYDTHEVKRYIADRWYRDDLIRHGIMHVVAWVVYIMLRCFGFLHW